MTQKCLGKQMKISIKKGQMFIDVNLSVDELKPILAKEISKVFQNPVSVDDLLDIQHQTDDDDNLVNLVVQIKITPPDEPA